MGRLQVVEGRQLGFARSVDRATELRLRTFYQQWNEELEDLLGPVWSPQNTGWGQPLTL